MACNIESIPAEISLLILEDHIGNPNDLSALIRASPAQYNVFRRHQTAVLAAVLRRAIHPSLMRLAIQTVVAKSVSYRVLKTEIEDLLQWYRDRGHNFHFEDTEIGVEHKENPDEGEDRKKGRALARLMRKCDINYDQLEPSNIAKESRKLGKAQCEESVWSVKERLLRALQRERSTKSLHGLHIRKLKCLQDCLVLKQLCQLWRIVDYFVLNYVQTARLQQKLIQATNPWAYSGTDWKSIIIPKKPSEIEYGRLQRAFINIERYRHIRGCPELDSAAPYTSIRSHYRWNTVPPTGFEFLEFFIVYKYLLTYTINILERVEIHAEEQIKVAASKCYNHARCDYISPSSDHFSGLPLFKFKNELDIFLCSAVKLGLPFLKKLGEIGIMQKLTVLNKISQLMDERHYQEVWEASISTYSRSNLHKNSLKSPSHGIVLLGGKVSATFNDAKYLPLREQGYIFWDDIDEVCNLKEIKYPLSSGRFHRSRDWSLETQLYLDGWAIARETLEATLPLVMTESEIITLVDSCDY